LIWSYETGFVVSSPAVANGKLICSNHGKIY